MGLLQGRRAWHVLVAALLVALPLAAWLISANEASQGVWVLGYYRERWFVLNLILSALCLPPALFLLARARRKAYFAWIGCSLASALILAILEAVAMVGLVDYRAALLGEQGRSIPDFDVRRSGLPNSQWRGNWYPNLVENMGLAAAPIPFEFSLDEYGLRNPLGLEDTAVYVIGDSIVVGAPVPVEQTLTQRIAAKLERSARAVAEVGSAPQESLERLASTALPTNDKLLIHVIFEGNDLEDSRAWNEWRQRPRRTGWPRSGFTKSGLQFLKKASARAADGRWGWYDADDGTRERIYFLYDGHRTNAGVAEIPRLSRELAERVETLRSGGARYLMVFVPFKLSVFHPYMTWPEESALGMPSRASSQLLGHLESWSKEHGVPLVDSTDALRTCFARGDELPYYPLDTHLTACGHDAVADAVATYIGSQPDFWN